MDFLPVDPVEFAPGQKDLKIELQSGGSLQASVLVDETLSLMNLWVRLEPPAGAEKDPDVNRLPIFLSNRLYGQHREEHEGLQVFRWGALWPGVYRLEILPRGSRTPVVTVEDIQIVPGERTRDPRLDGIDLRGRFRSIQILIQDENGRQMKGASLGAMVFINESLFETEAHAFTADSGIASVVTGDPQVDLLVTARGYQPRALFGVSEDTTVSLEPYPEVLVRIAGGAPELPEGNELRVALTKRGRQRDDRMFVSATIMSPMVDFYFHPRTIPEAVDDRGEITLQVEDDGTYSLAVSVRNNVLRQTATVRDVVPSELQVQTAAGRQVFEVRISAESLKQALAEVGGR